MKIDSKVNNDEKNNEAIDLENSIINNNKEFVVEDKNLVENLVEKLEDKDNTIDASKENVSDELEGNNLNVKNLNEDNNENFINNLENNTNEQNEEKK